MSLYIYLYILCLCCCCTIKCMLHGCLSLSYACLAFSVVLAGQGVGLLSLPLSACTIHNILSRHIVKMVMCAEHGEQNKQAGKGVGMAGDRRQPRHACCLPPYALLTMTFSAFYILSVCVCLYTWHFLPALATSLPIYIPALLPLLTPPLLLRALLSCLSGQAL